MKASEIVSYLSLLSQNNSREWFNANKDLYKKMMGDFELIVDKLIESISVFDPDCTENGRLSAKECVFRIYRDVRFSLDKSPYKQHFGAYIAPKGGRKSIYAGYYLHIEPNNKSFICCGIYSPSKEILKELRKAIYNNYDEWVEITTESKFANNFTSLCNFGDELKRIPLGFPSDFEGVEILKHRHIIYDKTLSDNFFDSNDFLKEVSSILSTTTKINRFINFTIDNS